MLHKIIFISIIITFVIVFIGWAVYTKPEPDEEDEDTPSHRPPSKPPSI